MSTTDWILVAVQGLVVIAFIALGVRSGGIGLGLWGGVGTLVLVFVFGLDPGEPPISAMLIIIAVISAAAAMQAAGGVDYMVKIASKALRARPKALNFVAPYVSYVLTILTGTEQHVLLDHPGDQRGRVREQDPARARARRLDRRIGARDHVEPGRRRDGDHPAAGRDLQLRPRRRPADHDPGEHRRHLRDVGRHEPPRQGPRRRRRVPAPPGRRARSSRPRPPAEIVLQPYAKRSVAIFLAGVLAICVFGFVESIRPTVAAEGGGVEPMSVTPLIQMIMLTAAALILVFAHVKATDVPGTPIFKSGMVAMIALFGIAWMADTFIANNEDAIVKALGGLAENWPFMIAVAIFLVAGLTTSQSAATRTMVPLGLALGIGAGYMIAMWTAVVGVLFLPANGTQIAAAEADETGTTTLGKRVIDHSFQLPLQVCWIVTALVGMR